MLHLFSRVVVAATLLLIFAGGLVTSTQSGLSVPDWPNTYGHFMFAYPLDEMVGGIFFEHSHRMIASVVGFLTVLLAVWLWLNRSWPGFVVAAAGVIANGIAVAVNGAVVPRGRWAAVRLVAGDDIEIVKVLQGG